MAHTLTQSGLACCIEEVGGIFQQYVSGVGDAAYVLCISPIDAHAGQAEQKALSGTEALFCALLQVNKWRAGIQ